MVYIGIAAVVLVVIGGMTALLVVIFSGRSEKKGSGQFEVLPDEKPLLPPKPVPQVLPQDRDNDLTVKLFDYNAYDSVLKSYVLEIYDLRKPGQGYRVNVDDRITIGRNSGCTVCIPNKTLSGEHCEIVLDNGTLVLRDLDSLNGTYVNGNPVRIRQVPLASGSIVQIGSEKLQVHLREVNV